MKKLFLPIILLCSGTIIYSQDDKDIKHENIVKINVGSIAVKNIALQYERAVGKKQSVSLGVRFQPYGDVPFQSWLKDQVDDPDILIGSMQMGNFALTPEFRFYFGKENLKGFYLAPYARYASYRMETPVRYTGLVVPKTAFFKGDIYSYSGGLLAGSQFNFGKHFVLDWWIAGFHFGGSSGQLDFTASLTPVEQADIRSTLDNVDIPLFKIRHNIHGNGGEITSKGAWAGFRGFAINVGYRF
jgi:Protein of unknown function (DUF3575)